MASSSCRAGATTSSQRPHQVAHQCASLCEGPLPRGLSARRSDLLRKPATTRVRLRSLSGGNPGDLRLSFPDVETIQIDEDGSLALDVPGECVRLERPLVYQETADGTRRSIAGEYVILGRRTGGVPPDVAFRLGAYDPHNDLTIDPILAYATYFGGGSTDSTSGIAVDSSGCAYVMGTTFSTDLPLAGPYQATRPAAMTFFVTKLSSLGTALVYSTISAARMTIMAAVSRWTRRPRQRRRLHVLAGLSSSEPGRANERRLRRRLRFAPRARRVDARVLDLHRRQHPGQCRGRGDRLLRKRVCHGISGNDAFVSSTALLCILWRRCFRGPVTTRATPLSWTPRGACMWSDH